MSIDNKTTATENEVLTREEYAQHIEKAKGITPESINAITVNLPAMQSAPMVATQTFAQFFAILKSLRVAYAEAPIDTTTTAGENDARAIRKKLVTLRTRADKVRTDHNRVFIEQQKANNEQFKMLEDTVYPLESRYDTAIMAKEKAAEAARLQREEDARARAAGITQFILDIAAHADDLTGLKSESIAVRIQNLTLVELNESELDHRFGEAVTIKDRTLARLEAAKAEKEQAEKDAAQVIADRARFDEEKAQREAKEAKERTARVAIELINTAMTMAPTLSPDALADAIGPLELANPEDYAPLQDEAKATIERVLPALRAVREEKLKTIADRARQDEENVRTIKESAARANIAAMKSVVADCVGASSSYIVRNIAEVRHLLMSKFDPFAKEAEAEQARVLTSLEKLHVAAVDEERTAAEKQAEAARAQAIDAAIANLEGTARRAKLSAMPAKSIRAEIEALQDAGHFTEATYGKRLQEASDIAGDEITALEELFDKVKAAEDKAACDAAEREARANEKAAEDAKRSRTVNAMAFNAPAMYEVLQDIAADEKFTQLNAATVAKVYDLLTDIKKAIKG